MPPYRLIRSPVGIALIAGLLILIGVSLSFTFPPRPPVEITRVSLNPGAVVVGEASILEFSAKNNENKAHFLRVTFNANPRVKFALGDMDLSREGDIWYFGAQLTPLGTLIQPIKVKATLESGMTEATYNIIIKFYVDSTQIDQRELKLTVRST